MGHTWATEDGVYPAGKCTIIGLPGMHVMLF